MQALAAISPLVPLLLLGATILIFLRIPVLTDLLCLPYTAVRWVVTDSGLFIHKQHWSVVYDAKTKLPIDPAYITVRNTLGVEVDTMITDLNGRFSLILPRGLYIIDVQKTHYTFPAFSLHNAHTDGFYADLYYGDTIDVTESERVITIAVPMDPIAEDWNQSEKSRRNVFLQLGKGNDFNITELLYLFVGILCILIHYYFYQDLFYAQLLTAYVAVGLTIFFWRLGQPAHHSRGMIIDKKTNLPLAFARITVFTAKHHQVVQKTTSFEGQFSCLVPKGRYYLLIERREDDGAYIPVRTTPVFHVYDGAIDRHFRI